MEGRDEASGLAQRHKSGYVRPVDVARPKHDDSSLIPKENALTPASIVPVVGFLMNEEDFW